MKFIAKYGIGIYLLVSLMYKVPFLIPVTYTGYLFNALMGLGLMLSIAFYKELLSVQSRKSFGIFYSIVAVNCAYLLFLNFNLNGVLYVLVKFATANLISCGILFNVQFYKKVFVKYFKYIIAAVILMGYLFGITPGGLQAPERLEIGFNPNDVGLFAAFGALSIMLFNTKWFRNIADIALFFLFILLVLISGSKGALLLLAFGTVLIYRFKFKIIFAGIVFLIVANASSNLGFKTGIDRLTNTDDVFDTREDTYDKGSRTIQDAFWTGHGLDKYAWTDPKFWPASETPLGPHNAYMSVLIMYGAVFGAVFFFLLLLILLKTIGVYWKTPDFFVKFCSIIVLLVLVNALFESVIVGVNEFITILFWFAVGVTGYYKTNYLKIGK